jgi:uncharacterized protein
MSPAGRPHGPAWFDISTPGAARARHLYRELFSWPVQLIDQTCALAGGYGGQPAGGIGQAGPGSPYAGIVVYFPADDVDSSPARAEGPVAGAPWTRPTPLSAASPCSPTPAATESGWSVADHTDQRSSAPDTGDSPE